MLCAQWVGTVWCWAVYGFPPLVKTQRSVGLQHAHVWYLGSGTTKTLFSFVSPESRKELAFTSFNFAPFTGRFPRRKAW